MKKFTQYVFCITILLSCKKIGTPELQPINLKISTVYASTELGKKLSLSKVLIKILNVNTNVEKQLITDANGNVSFQGISAGVYDISATITIPAATYSSVTGEIVDKDVIFNASDKNKTIGLTNNELNIKLVSGNIGNWLIKQIYYAGSNTTTGAGYRDQFIEIYNNTDSVMYADSLYFAEIIGRQSYTNTSYYTLPNGQMDWSKSLNMPSNIDANNNYVYPRALFMLPGKGKEHPVLPGASIVIAQTAINHKSPFTGTDGKTITVRDPSLTIDLSGADFEAYYAPFLPRPLTSDIDNPSIPNLNVLAYNGTDMLFDNPGRTAFIIFKRDGTEVKDYPKYNYPTISTPSSTSDKFYQIPNSVIIDAVEIQPNTASDRVPKKLGASLDAGYTFAPNGQYSSQSVIRKTDRTENGRKILKDTNNSTEDFDYFSLANPRGFK
ncbi:DUF4876 domain-containing protein [Pedobacter jejuensis]|uniref:DUF4876 domain-containing protein n=1 Tax=Pedobacter jejuensis TaxID=1268550 RepID=A0A3N0BPK1_9SPHI|nr:DUF4876 domain-containing protein [Pedobacter jejuensis]RNL50988.1 DUF4876 domain-containing protein [Pedobacter jejuensis]